MLVGDDKRIKRFGFDKLTTFGILSSLENHADEITG